MEGSFDYDSANKMMKKGSPKCIAFCRRLGRMALGGITLLFLLSGVVMLLGVLFFRGEGTPHLWGFRLLRIKSDSMQPLFSKGESVLVREVVAERLSPGDHIAFYGYADQKGSSTPPNGILLFHTITKVQIQEGERAFKTKGSANSWEDPFFTSPALVLGRYVPLPKWVVQGLGGMISPQGFFLGVILPAGGVFVFQMWAVLRMIQEGKQEKKSE